jgi:hypothetical protein
MENKGQLYESKKIYTILKQLAIEINDQYTID